MEELKLIMQTLAGLGETAKEGFIWWLVIDKLVPTLLLSAFGGSVVALGAYIARKVYENSRADADAAMAKEGCMKTIATIRGILGVYTFPNSKKDSSPSYYGEQEFKDTIDAVRAVKGAAERKGVEE